MKTKSTKQPWGRFALGLAFGLAAVTAAGQLASADEEPASTKAAAALPPDAVPALADPDDAPQLLASAEGTPLRDGAGRVALIYPEKADEVLASVVQPQAKRSAGEADVMVRYVDHLDVLTKAGAVDFVDPAKIPLNRYCTVASVKAETCRLDR